MNELRSISFCYALSIWGRFGIRQQPARIVMRNRAEMGSGECGFLQFQGRGFEV